MRVACRGEERVVYMCGICGIVFADGERRVDAAMVEAMNCALTHRGPDDAGLWDGGHVALAMRRLSVIDVAGGHQPMVSDDGDVVIVFNGEIYNFQEIRDRLEARGAGFRTRCDTEVVLRAYEAYGDAFLSQLNGMFAIAIYDRRQDRLLLARDRAGIKPLFYCVRDGAIVFASELDALLRSGRVRGALNAAALDAYFTYLYIPAPDTIFRDVQKLLPGEKLMYQKGQAQRERHWKVRYAPDASMTLDSASEQFLSLLDDAVRLHRISDVPLGAFLSGGLDSSAVVSSLAAMSSRPVKTFTIGFDDAQADELGYARAVAKRYGTDHVEAVLKPDAVALLPRIIRHFGEPFADSSALPTWLVSQVARQQVAVALSGDGGDELFAGYAWTRMTHLLDRCRAVPEAARRIVGNVVAALPDGPFAARLRRLNEDAFLDPLDVFRRRQTCFDSAQRSSLYQHDVAAEVALGLTNRFAQHARAARQLSVGDAMLYHDFAMYLPDDILTKVDRMSMAHSLEARVPLLDYRLIEFAATVPFPLKLRGCATKRVMRHALRSRLPRTILRQRKRGFAIPIHRWFREKLRSHFDETVLQPGARCHAYLRPEAIQALFAAHTQRKADAGHHLWALLMFEHWLRYVEAIPGVSVGFE